MMSSRASSQAADQRIFFFGSSGISKTRPRVEAEPFKNTRLARGGPSPVRAGRPAEAEASAGGPSAEVASEASD
jgi:hypothetical protein